MKKQATFGFIGCGNMGGAIATAVLRGNPGASVLVSDHHAEKTAALKALGACPSDSTAVARSCDYLFLGVKPQAFSAMLNEIRPALAMRDSAPVVVSMAAGITLSALESALGETSALVRIMPNTPVSVGEGLILYTANANVAEDALSVLLDVLKSGGRTVSVREDKIDAGSAVAGCGPAFACLFLEALADGGVQCGLSRADALTFAAQMMKGTAELVLKTGKHPGVLKDEVCSPGGSTIEGVGALEEHGFRAAAMDAVLAAYRKTLAMKK